MENEVRLAQFNLGDVVSCKTVDEIDLLAGKDNFIVIDKTDDELVIENENGKKTVSPISIRTKAEHQEALEKGRKDFRKAFEESQNNS